MKKIILHKGKEKSVLRYHPWIFSGAVLKKDPSLRDGDIVEVYNFHNQYLATGQYSNSSTCVKIFSFHKVVPDRAFWKQKLENALALRQQLGIIDSGRNNIFRLVNGEGDGMPGLIIDWFNGHVVLQFHAYGMYLLRELLADLLQEIFGGQIRSIYDKSAATLPEIKGFTPNDQFMYGTAEEVVVSENGVPFFIDIVNGQKTGFFIDQRDSRQLVGQYARNKRVLNLFCYTGGFSAYALAGGGTEVNSVDISKKAIELTEKNIAMLGETLAQRHHAYAENVFDFLEGTPDQAYDLIVLDPPAFAKHHKVKDQGVKGYRNLNRKALQKVKHGGLLFTFSCSQAISKEDFQTIVFSAAALEQKRVRVIKHLEAATDHPVDIFHPEGSYLKGLLVYVEDAR